MSESGVAERLKQVETLAIEVFISRTTALAWLASPNFALYGRAPDSLCATILGALQVRRLLRSIEYGGVYKLRRLSGSTRRLLAPISLGLDQ